jgi:hypothetical protein
MIDGVHHGGAGDELHDALERESLIAVHTGDGTLILDANAHTAIKIFGEVMERTGECK